MSYLKSVVLADTVIWSYHPCHRAVYFFDLRVSRRQCEGFVKSCFLPKTIGHLLVSFVLCSWGEKYPMAPMITRREDEDDTMWQDAITMAIWRVRWTHESNTKTHHRVVFGEFLTCQRFWRRSRSCCRRLRKSTGDHTMAQDALTNALMFSRSQPNLCQLRQCVTLA